MYRFIRASQMAIVISEVAQSCATLCNPMDCSLAGFSICGILQARKYWNGLPFPSPGDLPDWGLNPGLSHCRQTDALPFKPSGKSL